jgi:DNA-binding GntR family transcriptional regulator
MVQAAGFGQGRRLETVSTVEALESALAARIWAGDFVPGQHLLEQALAEEYGVGRHSLRAAFDGLTRRALLERKRNQGVFVRTLTRRDLDELYEVRSALEVLAFRTLAERRTVPQDAVAVIERLQNLPESAFDATSAHGPISATASAVIAADLAFHGAIVDGTGNARLARAYDDLRGEVRLALLQLVERYAPPEQIAHAHTDLLSAIGSGDPARAEHAIREHLIIAPRRRLQRQLNAGLERGPITPVASRPRHPANGSA